MGKSSTGDQTPTNKSEKIKRSGIIQTIQHYLDKRRLGDLLLRSRLITETALHDALNIQRENGERLGAVLVREKLISRRQLYTVLARQSALRAVATILMAGFLISSVSIKRAKASGIQDLPKQISMNVQQDFNYMAAFPALFGTEEKRSYNLKPFTKWTGMFERMHLSINKAETQQAIYEIKSNLKGLEYLPLKTMAQRVNNIMNKKRYIVDSKNWGKSDYWATPAEFMERGGDCEDFAIAKYTALRALGVPEERLRLAIVQDQLKNIPHAILIVYTDEGAFALDNQIKSLVDAGSMDRYKPIFSINRTAWWLHTAPNGTQIASAN